MTKRLFLVLIFTFGFSLLCLAQAPVENLPEKGLVTLYEDYQIFPANRLGNSLYFKKKRIFSRQELIVRDIYKLDEGAIIYATSATKDRELELYGPEDASMTKLDGGFYALKIGSEKKLVRIYKDDTIQDLLPKSRTPDGLVVNEKGDAVFSHITSSEMLENDGKKSYVYGYKIHFVFKDEKRVTHNSTVYKSTDLPLQIKWVNDTQVELQVFEGEPVRINAR